MERRVKVTGLLACVLVFMLAVGTSYGQLSNAGFENGLTGWSTFNLGGGILGTGTGASGNLASGSPHGGLNVLQLYGPFNGQWDAAGAVQNIAVSAGQTLTLTGYGMDPSGDPMLTTGLGFGEIQIVFRNSGGTGLLTIDSNAIDKSAGNYDVWQLLTASGVAPATTVSADIYALHVNGPDYSGGSAYFDDLAVVVPEPSSIALALAGLLGLTAVIRKRR